MRCTLSTVAYDLKKQLASKLNERFMIFQGEDFHADTKYLPKDGFKKITERRMEICSNSVVAAD